MDILDSLDRIAVRREGAEEVVESDSRVTSDVDDAEGRVGRCGECGERCEEGDVVDGCKVDVVIDIRDKPKLEATFHHPPDEVIGVCDWGSQSLPSEDSID